MVTVRPVRGTAVCPFRRIQVVVRRSAGGSETRSTTPGGSCGRVLCRVRTTGVDVSRSRAISAPVRSFLTRPAGLVAPRMSPSGQCRWNRSYRVKSARRHPNATVVTSSGTDRSSSGMNWLAFGPSARTECRTVSRLTGSSAAVGRPPADRAASSRPGKPGRCRCAGPAREPDRPSTGSTSCTGAYARGPRAGTIENTVPSSGADTASSAATAAPSWSRVVFLNRQTSSTPSVAGATAAASVTGSSGGVSTRMTSYCVAQVAPAGRHLLRAEQLARVGRQRPAGEHVDTRPTSAGWPARRRPGRTARW